MKVETHAVTVKGYGNKKHEFSVEKTEITEHISSSIKKNGNRILTCDTKEFAKIKKFFSEV